MDLGEVGLEGALERDDALDEEGIGVFEVQVHHTHHQDTHHLGTHQVLELGEVVGLDRSGDELALLAGAHWRGFDILERGKICRKQGRMLAWVSRRRNTERTGRTERNGEDGATHPSSY